MSDIFRKTTLGYEEIVSRVNGLAPRLRRCLIIVDGKRTMIELMGMLQGEDISPLIQTLEIEGYIELIGNSTSGPQRATTITPATNLFTNGNTLAIQKTGVFVDSLPMYLDRNGQPRKPLSFPERKLRALHAVNELLGPDAEMVAMKIEVCYDEINLDKALRTATIFLNDAVNPMAAKRFKDHVRLADFT
jgi:hypothetical protein